MIDALALAAGDACTATAGDALALAAGDASTAKAGDALAAKAGGSWAATAGDAEKRRKFRHNQMHTRTADNVVVSMSSTISGPDNLFSSKEGFPLWGTIKGYCI